MAQKYKVQGILECDVTVELEASTPDEAESNVDMADVTVSTEGVHITYCCISRFQANGTAEDITTDQEREEMDEDDDLKFRVEGELEIEIVAEVEAESYSEAEEKMDELDVTFDDGAVICTDLTVNRFEVGEDTLDMNAHKWDEEMSKKQRMEFLLDIGCTDDCAYDVAGMESHHVREEWLSQVL